MCQLQVRKDKNFQSLICTSKKFYFIILSAKKSERVVDNHKFNFTIVIDTYYD